MRLLAACTMALVTASCAGATAPPPPKPPGAGGDPFLSFATTTPTVGEVAPPIELVSTTGETVRVASARGPVVLVFASFTCPPSRMKLPGFEAMAQRWAGKASVFIVYSREAHPHAKSSARLNGFADQVQARDRNGDGTVTLAEYGDLGERYMFDAFDLDHDGEVRSYELLAARRLDQFKDIDAPTTIEQRMALARELRAQVPGAIPILVDGLDDAVATRYGGLPNMAYVIGADGKVAFKLPWAAVGDLERALAQTSGLPVPPASPPDAAPDLTLVQPQLAAAKAEGRPVLLELTAIGCHACEAMARTLAEPAVHAELARYHVVPLGIERDAAWRLFESLQLSATHALVTVSADGRVLGTLQGARDREAVTAFLQHGPR